MSTNTSIHVGYYLVCTQSVETVEEPAKVCKANKKHEISCAHPPKFCPQCGHPVVDGHTTFKSPVCLYDIADDDSSSKEDVAFLRKWSSIALDWVGMSQKGHQEILVPDDNISIDADNEGAHNFSPKEWMTASTAPVAVDIERLQTLVRYTKVEVRFGVLVQIA